MYLLVRYDNGTCVVFRDGAAILARTGSAEGELAIDWGRPGPDTERLAMLLLLDSFGNLEHAQRVAPELARKVLATLPSEGGCLYRHHLLPFMPPEAAWGAGPAAGCTPTIT